MECKTCGKELGKVVRRCTICKATLCLDCVRYMVVRKKTLYKEYEDSIPVCRDCLPEIKLRGKLAKIVDEVFLDWEE